ncbi:MAG: hypothetical protein Q9163_000775 [Psora crenata]
MRDLSFFYQTRRQIIRLLTYEWGSAQPLCLVVIVAALKPAPALRSVEIQGMWFGSYSPPSGPDLSAFPETWLCIDASGNFYTAAVRSLLVKDDVDFECSSSMILSSNGDKRNVGMWHARRLGTSDPE